MPYASAPTRSRPTNRVKHQAVCNNCGIPANLPFRPTQGKPVYCNSCFKAHRQEPAAGRKARSERSFAPKRQSDNGARPPVVSAPPSDEAPTIDDSATGGTPFAEFSLKSATKAAIARMNISTTTPIQEKAIPHLLEGRDLIGQARTGSGKTLAYAVPLAEKCDSAVRAVQALVLTPTRELAIQVAGVIESLVSAQQLSVTLLYGGRSLVPEYKALKKRPQIVIGTPGRTLDHLKQGTLKLDSVRFLVLDEADEMLDMGFAPDVQAIIGQTPSPRQTALMSATMPDWVAKTAAKHLQQPVKVEVDAGMTSPSTVAHRVYSIQKSEKMGALKTLLDQRDGAPVIVFGKTRHGVKKLAKQLDEMGYPALALQGDLSQRAREQVMKNFRSGTAEILVATNVAARGLDFEDIGQVINFDLPDSEQSFTHRVGRTGRMGRLGESVTLITREEERKWHEIERGLGRKFSRQPWSKSR